MAKEEKTRIDVSKLIKLRDQIDVATKIDRSEQQKYSNESQSYSYRLGKLHGLEEIRVKLNELIIQG